MFSSLQITVAVILTLTNAPIPVCGNAKNVDGCYDPATNTITINTALTDEELRYVLLHEVAHAKYNKINNFTIFEKLPKNEVNDTLPLVERMANWFVIFWRRPTIFDKIYPEWALWYRKNI